MEAIIMIGIPGSGKSHYCHEHFEDTHLRLNLDSLGRRSRERIILEAAVKAKVNIVIDNTNITLEHRQKYMPLFKENGYKIIAYYFEPHLDLALWRNGNRKRNVPIKAIKQYHKDIVEPDYSEGFDEIRRVGFKEWS